MEIVGLWSVNGMVRREKNTSNLRIISFKIYNPGILLFLTIESGAEFGPGPVQDSRRISTCH